MSRSRKKSPFYPIYGGSDNYARRKANQRERSRVRDMVNAGEEPGRETKKRYAEKWVWPTEGVRFYGEIKDRSKKWFKKAMRK